MEHPATEQPALAIGPLRLAGRVMLAPMAAFTSAPWRAIASEFGASLCVTEMVKAELLLQGHPDTQRHVRRLPGEGPGALQVAGSDPDLMARGAAYAADAGFQAVDINCGCAVRRIRGCKAGSALLDDPPAIGRIVAAMVKLASVPVTVKFRSGLSDEDLSVIECARIAEAEGAAAVAVHPRTVQQRMGGDADWSVIARVREAVTIPVFGNGDVNTADDAARMIRQTGCDAVMLGRGALGNPWLIRDAHARIENLPDPGVPSPTDVLALARRHHRKLCAFLGDRVATNMFRKLGSLYAERAGHAQDQIQRIRRTSDPEAMQALLA